MTEIRLIPTVGTPTVLLQDLDPAPASDEVEPPQVQFGTIRFADQFGVPVAVDGAQLVLTEPLRLIDFLPSLGGRVWGIRLFGGEAGVSYPAVLRVPGYPDSLLALVVRQPVVGTPSRLADVIGLANGVSYVVLGRVAESSVVVRGKELLT